MYKSIFITYNSGMRMWRVARPRPRYYHSLQHYYYNIITTLLRLTYTTKQQ